MNYSHTESYHGYNDIYIAELITPVNDVKEIGVVKCIECSKRYILPTK